MASVEQEGIDIFGGASAHDVGASAQPVAKDDKTLESVRLVKEYYDEHLAPIGGGFLNDTPYFRDLIKNRGMEVDAILHVINRVVEVNNYKSEGDKLRNPFVYLKKILDKNADKHVLSLKDTQIEDNTYKGSEARRSIWGSLRPATARECSRTSIGGWGFSAIFLLIP